MRLDNQALMRAAGIGAAAMAMLGVIGGIPMCGMICCLAPLAHLGVGAGYTFFAGHHRTTPTPRDAALGGTIAGGFAGAIFAIVWSISASIFTTPESIQASFEIMEQVSNANFSPEMVQAAAQGPGLTTILACMCTALVIGAMGGALGAALAAMRAGGLEPPAR